MKFCTKCGHEMYDEAVVCVSCGTESKTKSQTSNTLPIAALVCSFFIAIVGVGLGAYGAYKCKGVNDKGFKLSVAAIVVGVLNMIAGAVLNTILPSLLEGLLAV